MLPLSVAIVCRNNEATIGRTLESVAGLAAEVVAVDSGSTDGTIPMLERAGARVIRTEWRGHVATKQMALEACRQVWILSLDSDESLSPLLRKSIQEAIGDGAMRVDGYRVNRKVFYRDRPLNHVWQPEHRLRLVRQGRARWTGLDPHDKLELIAACSASSVVPPLLEGDLRHDSISTFSEFMAKQAVHGRTMAASLAATGHRGSVLRMITSPPGAFLKQVVVKQAWRDGWPGWLAAAATAGATLMKHMALLELTRDFPAGDGGAASGGPAGGYDSAGRS